MNTIKKKVALISLGCEKNLVDSEMILGLVRKGQVEIVSDVNYADIIIINTCGFIQSAKEEAIDTIIDSLKHKERGAKIVVTGCLAQRYLENLKEEIPEVDLWVPLKDYYKFGDLFKTVLDDQAYYNVPLMMEDRLLSTPNHLAYVRISDGCNNRCTYCAIPLIRGNFVSRRIEDIVNEIKSLILDGRKEICLISQDLTNYGYDINESLESLLKEILKIDNLPWIRLLYLYPDEISDELIEIVANNDKILPYFDIPIQHASNKVLKYMHRRGDKEFLKELVAKIRSKVKDVVIRTTIMVGFPHESEKDFNEMLEFIEEVKFNHLGAFTYSKEEDTLSYDYTMQVPEKIKKNRLNILMDKQRWISLALNKKMINRVYDCIIESYDSELDKYYGRTYAFAPDDIDGEVIISNDGKNHVIGEMVKVKITDVDFYDLFGEFN